jgi:PPOX class probable F420-dependent enzyme
MGSFSADFLEFWTERHLATLATPRPDGSVHVVPVGVTVDADTATARVICSAGSRKARNVQSAAGSAMVALCQVDGRRWSTIEGAAVLRADPADVADAERRYEARYRRPRPNPQRVVIEVTITRVLGIR